MPMHSLNLSCVVVVDSIDIDFKSSVLTRSRFGPKMSRKVKLNPHAVKSFEFQNQHSIMEVPLPNGSA
jgi:hypothetical protein